MKKNNKEKKEIIHSIGSIILIVFISLFFIISNKNFEDNKPEEVSYNEFLEYIKQKKVDTVYYSKDEEYMRFTLLNDETKNILFEITDLISFPLWKILIEPFFFV